MSENEKERDDLISTYIRKHRVKVEKSLKEITPAIFSNFLIEKDASQTCLSCGSSKLVVPESTDLVMADGDLVRYNSPLDEERIDESNRFIDYVSYSKIDPDSEISFSNVQYTVHCMNCGFMAQYKAGIVVSWYLKETKKSKDDA